MSESTPPFNRHGGLTIAPMPGFEEAADAVMALIGKIGAEKGMATPVDIATIKIGSRANGEPFAQLGKQHVGGHDVVLLTSGPGTRDMLLDTQLALQYLSGRRAARIALVTGYFPLSRSDKDEGNLELALPHFITSQFVGAAGDRLDRIIAVDLHAPQVVMSGRAGLITELSQTRSVVKAAVNDAMSRWPDRRIVVAFPDDGAQKRSGKILDAIETELNVPLPSVCGVKRRASSTESKLLQVFGNLEQIRGAVVLCLDDEIATGGTNIATAKAMKEHYGAAQVFAVVTHGVLCGDAPARFAAPDCPVDGIWCTDTIPAAGRLELKPLIDGGRLMIKSWAKDLAWAVFNHHWDESIRDSSH
jgi:ribose-phosphate pyrophosphokinase